jgi:hypothetical protein
MNFQQTIAIDGLDHVVHVIKKDSEKSDIIIITGCGCEYNGEITNDDAIKKLQFAFRNQQNFKYSAKFIEETCQLEIQIYNSSFNIKDIYLLAKKQDMY